MEKIQELVTKYWYVLVAIFVYMMMGSKNKRAYARRGYRASMSNARRFVGKMRRRR